MKDYLQRAWDAGYPIVELEREQILARAQIGEVHAVESDIGGMLTASDVDQREVSQALAAGFFRINEVSRALEILAAWMHDYPDDAEPYCLRAEYLAHENSFAEAAGDYRAALQRDENYFAARLGLADALRNLNDNESAVAEYEGCLRVRPDDVDATVGLAASLTDLGRRETVRSLLASVLAVEPDHVNARLGLAELDLTEGNTEAAIGLLEQVLSAEPFHPVARYQYATALSLAGRHDEAKAQFDYVDAQTRAQSQLRNLMEQLVDDPTRMELRYEVGKTLLDYGDPREGASWLETSLQFDPSHAGIHQLLAGYYTGIGRRDLAAQHAREAQAAAPNQPQEPAE